MNATRIADFVADHDEDYSTWSVVPQNDNANGYLKGFYEWQGWGYASLSVPHRKIGEIVKQIAAAGYRVRVN